MASDQRSDIYVVRLEAALTDSETVLRMMDGRHARGMGLLVLTRERIHFPPRRRTGPNFSVPLEEILAIEAYTRWGTGTVRIITPYGSLTVDQILGRQGGMLAADARATIRGEPPAGYWPNSAHCATAARSAPPSSRSASPRSGATSSTRSGLGRSRQLKPRSSNTCSRPTKASSERRPDPTAERGWINDPLGLTYHRSTACSSNTCQARAPAR